MKTYIYFVDDQKMINVYRIQKNHPIFVTRIPDTETRTRKGLVEEYLINQIKSEKSFFEKKKLFRKHNVLHRI